MKEIQLDKLVFAKNLTIQRDIAADLFSTKEVDFSLVLFTSDQYLGRAKYIISNMQYNRYTSLIYIVPSEF